MKYGRPRKYDERFMKKFMKEQGYTIISVTKRSVRKVIWGSKALKSDHCLLIDAMIDAHEDSWLVLHKNVLWHNFHVERKFDGMYFLNNPTECVYLVWHPKWSSKPKDIKKHLEEAWKRAGFHASLPKEIQVPEGHALYSHLQNIFICKTL